MTLTLRAVSLNDHPLTQPITAHFDAGGGSIGRADHNTLALPSPERHVSRQQAEITFDSNGYTIRNVGSANPIVVGGVALARGESALLDHQDQVRIGGYLLEVVHEESADVEAVTVVRGRAAVDAATPGVSRRPLPTQSGSTTPLRSNPGGASNAIANLDAPLSRGNPFADLLGDSPPAAPSVAALDAYRVPVPSPSVASPQPSLPTSIPVPRASASTLFDRAEPPSAAGVPASSNAWSAPPPPPARQLLPDDFDPFAPPLAAPVAPARALVSDQNLFEDLIPMGPRASLDEAYDLGGGTRDPLADFMADLAPLRRPEDGAERAHGGGSVPVDPLAALGFLPPSALPNAVPTRPDHVPELQAAFVPPALRAPLGPVPPAVRVEDPPTGEGAEPSIPVAPAGPEAAEWAGDPQALWMAFCAGAGVAIHPPQGVNPELMQVVGGLLRAAVEGTLQLMTVRASAKHELRADVTMIQARNNNPLKFSPDARSALEQMLQPPMRGFLAGPAAMTDAMHDLVGHTIGTMAGTRAALEGVLDRFTPRQLEAKLSVRSVLDSVLPMNRKAKLWELYLQHFEGIRNEAHDDFHSLYGRAFLAAYEQQLERLQRSESAQGAG